MPASVRTLSQLPQLSSLVSESLFEVAAPVELSIGGRTTIKFASKSITAKNLSKKIVNDAKTEFANTFGISGTVNVTDISSRVDTIENRSTTIDGTKSFAEIPLIEKNISSFEDSSLNKSAVNLASLKTYANVNSAPAISPNFGFVTTLSDLNGNERNLNLFVQEEETGAFSNNKSFVLDENAKSIAQSEFVFRIEKGKRESGEWTAPASGIFTCYGWLDEINNPAQSNESRWVALLGKEEQLEVWTILQLQPFIKNNYLSYVGFTFPVKAGMKLKIMTGFAVGSNSDKYFAANSSITNHVANAFLGGIYTGLSVDDGFGTPRSFDNVTYNYATSADIEALSAHEQECDERMSGLIYELSNKLSNIISSDSKDPVPYDDTLLQEELKKRVKYIDPDSLSGAYAPKYAQISFGGGTDFKSYGAFNPNVKQLSSINGEKYYYECLSIDFNNPDNVFSYKNFYAPPTFSEMREEKTGYVERAYYYDDLPGGSIASDGQYFYYKVTKNCTVLIKLSYDVMSPFVNIVRAWMLYDTKRGYQNVKALPVLEKVESGVYNGYPSESITIPVKAGTMLMFGIYSREKLSTKAPWYVESLQPPVINSVLPNFPVKLSELKSNQEYLSFSYNGYNDGTTYGMTRKAILIRADGSNMNTLMTDDDKSETKYLRSKCKFGSVCMIYELP